jgi:hypothetical protein
MNNPADIINAAIETLLNEHCELPAFSTLDRMARRIRTLVNGGIYQRILARLDEASRAALSTLLQTSAEAAYTPFTRIKEPPKSATLTHLDEWLSRLIWLQSLGNTQKVLEGIRSNKIIHLAEEAQSLPATDVADSLPPKRFALGDTFAHFRPRTLSPHARLPSASECRARQRLARLVRQLSQSRGGRSGNAPVVKIDGAEHPFGFFLEPPLLPNFEQSRDGDIQ